MRRKSLPQKFDHVLRLARRRALAGSQTAYRLYLWLCDNEHRFVPAQNYKATPTPAMIRYSFRQQGWDIG